MQFSREASEIIQDFFNIEEIGACLELETGLQGNWGQTFLILHPSGLWALTRSSYADPCQKIRIDHRVPIRLQQRRFEEALTFEDDTGAKFTLRLYPANLEPARVFLEMVEALRDRLPDPSPRPKPPAPKAEKEEKPKSPILEKKQSTGLNLGTGTSSDAVRGNPVADPSDRLDAAGRSMQNFFERIIERIGDAPPAAADDAGNPENPGSPPSPDFLRLVDTGDVFSRIPSKLQQATEAYMAAWEKRPDPAVALKLANLYERLLAPEPQLLWMERAAEKMPPGADRDAIIDRILVLLEQKGSSPEILSSWKARRSSK